MPRIVLILMIVSLAGLGVVVASNQTAEKKNLSTAPWEKKLEQELPALGHRNWLVVADSAYPAQVSPGIEIVVSNEDHFVVLDKVLKALDSSRHVRPKIYLDKELSFLSEDLAPGIDGCKKRLEDLLKGREVKPVLHDELIARLDQVAKTFRILMIKTTMALPYTSVFMELDCGYWSPESEAKLRRKMS